MGFNTLTIVVLSPFLTATIDDWRLRYAGFGIAGVLAIYIACALNQLIVTEVHF